VAGIEFDLLEYGRGRLAATPQVSHPAGAEDLLHLLKVDPFPLHAEGLDLERFTLGDRLGQ